MKDNDSNVQGKTKHTQTWRKIMQLIKHKTTQGPTGLYELFLLTVPIEEVARCQYKTVPIIFHLNLQTIATDSHNWTHRQWFQRNLSWKIWKCDTTVRVEKEASLPGIVSAWFGSTWVRSLHNVWQFRLVIQTVPRISNSRETVAWNKKMTTEQLRKVINSGQHVISYTATLIHTVPHSEVSVSKNSQLLRVEKPRTEKNTGHKVLVPFGFRSMPIPNHNVAVCVYRLGL